METIPIRLTQTHRAHSQHFPPLEHESRPAVPTEQAALYLNRRSLTLRLWCTSPNCWVRRAAK